MFVCKLLECLLLFSLYHDIFRTVDASARSNATRMDELRQTYFDRMYETVANTDDYTDMTSGTMNESYGVVVDQN